MAAAAEPGPRSAVVLEKSEFPFPFRPYAVQEELMGRIYQAIESRRLGIFESPTGTGKTLSIICSAVHWLLTHADDVASYTDKDLEDCGRRTSDSDSTLKQEPDMPELPSWVLDSFARLEEKRQEAHEVRVRQLIERSSAVWESVRAAVRVQDVPLRFGESRKRARPSERDAVEESMTASPHLEDDSQWLLSEVATDEPSASCTDSAEDLGGSEDEADRAARLARLMRAERDASVNHHDSKLDDEAAGRGGAFWLVGSGSGAPVPAPYMRQVIFASRTHSQIGQFVRELRSTALAATARTIVLASRRQLCVNPAVRKIETDALLSERCLELRDQRARASAGKADGEAGPAASRPRDSVGTAHAVPQARDGCGGCPWADPAGIERLAVRFLSDPVEIEEAFRLGEEHGACPYYASRKAATLAHVVAMPYSSLLSSSAREGSGVRLRGNIVVIDEAHNLPSAASQANGATVTLAALQAAESQLRAYLAKYRSRLHGRNVIQCSRVIALLASLSSYLASMDIPGDSMMTPSELLVRSRVEHISLNSLVRWIDAAQLCRKLRGFAEAVARDAATLGSASEGTTTSTMATAMQSVRTFLGALLLGDRDGRVFRHTTSSATTLRFALLFASSAVHDVFHLPRAVILTGGTMPPREELQAQLFPDEPSERVDTFSCDHVVDPRTLMGAIVTHGPAGERFDFSMQGRSGASGAAAALDLGRALVNLVRIAPGGVAVFLPSYAIERDLLDERDGAFSRATQGQTGSRSILDQLSSLKVVLREPREASRVDAVLTEFAAAARSERGALLFAVMGGKLSEGLNFKDELARLVVVVGMPYPSVADPELLERRARMDQVQGSGAGQRLYESLCIQAVNQAIGRAVRHQHDWAAVVLADYRYASSHVRARLPSWLRPSVRSHETFGTAYRDLAAYFRSRGLASAIVPE